MNKLERKRLKRTANLKLLLFTFLGAFILFFTAFTYFLPMLAPKVEVPALSDDYVLDSITSQDFRGKVDPRLKSIEQQDDNPESSQVQNRNSNIQDSQSAQPETEEVTTPSDQPVQDEPEDTGIENNAIKEPDADIPQRVAVNVPPRPRVIELREKKTITSLTPVSRATVVVGSFANPKEVKIASDILTNLNYSPIIKERNGGYILQVGTFSDTQRAEEVVNDLKSRNFDASIEHE